MIGGCHVLMANYVVLIVYESVSIMLYRHLLVYKYVLLKDWCVCVCVYV